MFEDRNTENVNPEFSINSCYPDVLDTEHPGYEVNNVTGDFILVSPEPTVVLADATPEVYDRWAVCGLRDAMKAKGQQPPWVINELLLSKSAALVSAKPHAMKSLSWLAACMEAVKTGNVWGHFKAPNVDSTLFIETEDPQWLVEARINGLAKGLGLSDKDELSGFHYVCPGPFDFLEEIRYLEDIFKKHKPKFAVLSTLQSLLVNRSWLSQQDMQPILAKTIQLSRQCPLIMITHSPQDGRQRRAAGTVTQDANFATLIHYEKKQSKERGTFVNAKLDSKAGMGGQTFALRLVTEGPANDPGSVRKIVYESAGQASALRRQAVIEELPADPTASTADIAERAGASPRYVQEIRKEQREQRELKKMSSSAVRGTMRTVRRA